MPPLQSIIGDHQPFLNNIFTLLEKDGIDVTDYELDHICYRVAGQARYEELKQALFQYGSLLVEAQIGGRPVSTFHLNDPLTFNKREIPCLELPAPKEGSYYPEGYEHVEFVIDLDFSKFRELYPQVNFDTQSMNKKINPDIKIDYATCSVKFHHYSLKEVIERWG